MAGAGGAMPHGLNRLARLLAEPDRYDFHAALRLLECAHPQLPRIGGSLRPQDDALRFGQSPSLAFEASMLGPYTPAREAGADPHRGPAPPRLEVRGFGLLGANGPLPLHLSEYVRDRLRNAADPTPARFLDLFQHRMVALFYRAWASGQPTVSLDRPEADRFSDYMAALIGLAGPGLRQRDAVPDVAKRHYAGQLAPQVRNADGLARLLADFFQMPVRIEEFVGHWMTLPADGVCRLRAAPGAAVLGMNTVLGTRVWNCQHKFRIVAGPLSLEQLRRLLPGGDSHRRLTDWVRLYAGLDLDWDVNLQLHKDAVPELRLGRRAALGWTSWLRSAPPPAHDRQLLLRAGARAA